MTVYGMPLEMFLIFVATIVAGSLGAVHYVIWHLILKKPFGDEDIPLERRNPTEKMAGERRRNRTDGRDPR